MITIKVEFYDLKTEFMVDSIIIEMPDDLVFKAADTNDIGKINAFMFDLSKEMKNHIIKNDPALKNKFEVFHADFTGRHGLGPEYD